MKKAQLIIADDHQVVRQGLRNLVERAVGLTVVAEAADGAAVESLAREIEADLLILDIALPLKRGMQVLESLRAGGCKTPVLLFSMYPASQYVNYARRMGAQGFIGKDASSEELLLAIRRILAGGTSFPKPKETGDAGQNPFTALSPRENEVLHGLLSGEPLGVIAARLGVGAKTISTYRRRLLDKLGVQSNAELAALAARNALS